MSLAKRYTQGHTEKFMVGNSDSEYFFLESLTPLTKDSVMRDLVLKIALDRSPGYDPRSGVGTRLFSVLS
jgi:hypothetical protein